MDSLPEPFLERIISILSKVKEETERRGYSTVGALVEMARSEAEDELRTQRVDSERLQVFQVNGTRAPR